MPIDQTFRDDGCLTFARMFDPALIDAVRAEYDAQYGDLQSAVLPPHLKVGKGRLQLPIRLSGALFDPALWANPLLSALLSAWLGSDFLIDNISCVTALAGAADQRLHRDHFHPFPEIPELHAMVPSFAITLAIPLVDLSPDTGATELFPGSHRGDTRTDDEIAAGPSVVPYVARGGCYVMDYRLLNRGTANRTGSARPVLYIIYSRPWFTDCVNLSGIPHIAIDRSDSASLPVANRPLFQRLAAKSAVDLTVKEFLAGAC